MKSENVIPETPARVVTLTMSVEEADTLEWLLDDLQGDSSNEAANAVGIEVSYTLEASRRERGGSYETPS